MPLALPWTFATAGANTPLARLDDNYLAIANWINARNPAVGLLAARPAPGNPGAIYVASDVANATYVDDGTSWQLVTPTVGGANFVEFQGIATPATPSAGAGRLFSPSAPSGLRRLRWLDAGAQLVDPGSILIRQSGNPLKDVNTTTTETSIFATPPTIKGGTFGTDRMLRIEVHGDVLSNAGFGQGMTFRLKYGGTTFANVPQYTLAVSATRCPWYFQGELAAGGATNVQVARAVASTTQTAGVSGVAVVEGNSATAASVYLAVHTGGAVDSTADQTFDVTLQPTVSSAALSIRVFAILVEVL